MVWFVFQEKEFFMNDNTQDGVVNPIKTEEAAPAPTLTDLLNNPFIYPGVSRARKIKLMKRDMAKLAIKNKKLHGYEKKLARKKYFA